MRPRPIEAVCYHGERRFLIPPLQGEGGEMWAAKISEEREATPPGRLPKSDVSDFGHLTLPKSGKPDFGAATLPEVGEG